MSKKEDSVDLKMGIGVILEGSEMEQIHFQMIFDDYVDQEIQEIEEQLKEEKLLRKVCLTKILCYPLELIITWILLGKIWMEERKEQNKIFIRYLKRDISTKDFQMELMNLSNIFLEKKNNERN